MTDRRGRDSASTPVSAGIDAFRRPQQPLPRSEVSRALDELVESVDPAVVLAGLVRLSVSIGFADGCELELTDGPRPLFRTSSHGGGEPSDLRERAVATPLHGPGRGRFEAFSGVLVHWWRGRAPGDDDRLVAELLVRHAVSVVDRQRLLDVLAEREEQGSRLTMQAITGRWLNVATGLVMDQLGVDADDAEEIVRDTARERGVDVWDLALEVVRSRGLVDRTGPPGASPAARSADEGTRRGPLRPVPPVDR